MNKLEEAKEVLRKAGYYVDNLWHLSDVTRLKSMSDEDAYGILDDALANEWIVEKIFDSISEFTQEV
jgi:hypothetical protein